MTTPGDFERTNPRAASPGVSRRGATEQGMRESVQRLAEDAQEQAGDAIESGVRRGKERLAESLGTVAEALRVSGNHLRERQEDVPRQYMERAAQQVERLSDYVRRNEPRDMIHGLESFARRQPAVFLGGTFLLGLLGARFLRSSQRDDRELRYERSYSQAGFSQSGYAQGGYGHGRGTGTGGMTPGGPTTESDIGSRRGYGTQADDVSLRGGTGGTRDPRPGIGTGEER